MDATSITFHVVLLVQAIMFVCMIIATVSLVRIARNTDELVGKFDDLKRELEGKGKE
jgi:hypothetical protein